MEGNKKIWMKAIWMFLSVFTWQTSPPGKYYYSWGSCNYPQKNPSNLSSKVQLGIESGRYYPWVTAQWGTAAQESSCVHTSIQRIPSVRVHLSSVSLCSFPSVEPVPGFSQAMNFETAPVINGISSQRKKCVQGVLHIGDILTFSSLAALLMRRCGFVAGDTSFHLVLCFLLLLFMSPVLCQYIYFDVNPFVTSSDFCLGTTTFFFSPPGDIIFVWIGPLGWFIRSLLASE